MSADQEYGTWRKMFCGVGGARGRDMSCSLLGRRGAHSPGAVGKFFDLVLNRNDASDYITCKICDMDVGTTM